MARKYDVPAWRQQQLIRMALRHSETSKADAAVLAEIVQRYHGKYGNAWATHEHLMEQTGLARSTIKRSRKALEHFGFMTILTTGVRGMASVYLPNFDIVPELGSVGDPLSKGFKDEPLIDDLGSTDEPETPLLRVKDGPPSYIQSPAYKAGRQDIDNDTAPASPPLSSGLEADDAGRAIDGFDQLYKAYGYRRNRAEAKAAYQKINPDPDLHAELVASAIAWRERWAAQNKPDAPRYTLAKWLERECYLEDPPAGYAKQKPEAKAPEKTRRKKMSTGSKDAPRRYIIQSADVEKDGGNTSLVMTLMANDGYTEEFDMLIDADSPSRSEEAYREFGRFIKACGLVGCSDSSELVGLSFMIDGDGEFCRVPDEATQNG